MARVPRGGRGSNQYQVRGAPVASPDRVAVAALQAQVEIETIGASFDESPAVTLTRGAAQVPRVIAAGTVDQRRRVASRRTNAPEVFELLSSDPDRRVQDAVAKNPTCPTSILIRLAGTPERWLALSANPNCPPEVLESIGRSTVVDRVSQQVAANPNCPDELIRWLAVQHRKGGASNVDAVISNPNCPSDLLAELADEHPDAVAHPNCPTNLVVRYARQKNFPPQRKAAARNPNCPPDVLAELGDDWKGRTWYPDLCSIAANNPSYPADRVADAAVMELEVGRQKGLVVTRAFADPDCPDRVFNALIPTGKPPHSPMDRGGCLNVLRHPRCPATVAALYSNHSDREVAAVARQLYASRVGDEATA